MTFPTIQTADTKNGTQTSNSNSWTLTYPTNLTNGDLILAFLALDGSPNTTWPANWIGTGAAGALDGNANARVWCAKKKSDGTETGNFTVSLNATEQGSWRVFRITDWEGTIGTDFNNASTGGAVIGISGGGGISANPNPPNLDPANWATEDTLWIAAMGADTSRTISVYPLANNQTADVSGGSGGATLGICTMNDAVSSKDPGTFTISSSDDWGTLTIAIRPAAAAIPVIPHIRTTNTVLQSTQRASIM